MNKVFHFIFGLAENFNNKPFCYFHYLCIKSCYLTQNNPIIKIHCLHEPENNEWWNKIKEFATIIKYKTLPDIVYFCNNKKVWRIEHQSDILRLLILKEEGGVYADVDTLFYKPFFPKFEKYDFVLGIEQMYRVREKEKCINGLCNALIICNKDSEFLKKWWESYLNEYDDYDWNKLSVRIPYILAQEYPHLIHVEPYSSFHKYDWNGYFYNKKMLGKERNIYSKHLCESKIYDYLKNLNPEILKNKNSIFARMCRNIKALI